MQGIVAFTNGPREQKTAKGDKHAMEGMSGIGDFATPKKEKGDRYCLLS